MMANSGDTCSSSDASPTSLNFFNLITNKPSSSNFTLFSQRSISDADISAQSEDDDKINSNDINITLEERLNNLTSIWFLPEIDRCGVVNLLQNKEPGMFIVRKSSKHNAMALSVRLPEGKDAYVEHYLIELSLGRKIHLEGSENYFSSITTLITHYCGCCDELPVQLILPKVLMESNWQQLISYSKLGQDFWNNFNKTVTILNNNDPLVDPSKSSTVPVQKGLLIPKPPPRTSITKSIPPPIPQRITKLQNIENKNSSEIENVNNNKQVKNTLNNTIKEDEKLIIETEEKEEELKSEEAEEHKDLELSTDDIDRYDDDSRDDESLSYEYSKSCGQISDSETKTDWDYYNVKDEDILHSLDSQGFTECESLDLDIGRTSKNGWKTSDTSLEIQKSSLSGNSSQCLTLNDFKSKKTVGSLIRFYKTKAEDKYSDYEDIWTCIQEKSAQSTQTEIKKHFGSESNLSTLSNSRKQSHSMESLSNLNMDYCCNIERDKRKGDVIIQVGDGRTNKEECGWLVDCSWKWKGSSDSLDKIDKKRIKNSKKITQIPPITFTSKIVLDEINNASKIYSDEKSNQNDKTEKISTSITIDNNKNNNKINNNNNNNSNNNLIVTAITLNGNYKSHDIKVNHRSSNQFTENLQPIKYLNNNNNNNNNMIINNINNNIKAVRLSLRDTINQNFHNEMNIRNETININSDKVNRDNLSKISDHSTETIFSEPWNSEFWENLMVSNDIDVDLIKNDIIKRQKIANNAANNNISNHSDRSSFDDAPISEKESNIDITEVTSFSGISDMSIQRSSELSSVLEYRTIKSEDNDNTSIGKNICDYIFKLAQEDDNSFAKFVSHFIDCTKDLQSNPITIMANIRQFMNGMKNYLVKHGEKDFFEMVKEERSKLKSDEFLNIDAIIEECLHILVIKPLKDHLDKLFLDQFKTNGNIALLENNIKLSQNKTPAELGIKSGLHPPNDDDIFLLREYFDKLKKTYSPIKKLEYLLGAISKIYRSVNKINGGSVNGNFSFDADDFLPIFIYVIIKCELITAELEAEYMKGLLQSSLLSGEGGYYLTMLSSCVHIIKNMHNESNNLMHSSQESSPSSSPFITPNTTINTSEPSLSLSSSRLPSLLDLEGYMKILIPNELSCSIITRTLPIFPHMTTREVCRLIAHKYNIANLEEYGLFKLSNEKNEELLDGGVYPQAIKAESLALGKPIGFAFKRIDAKFIWPKISELN